MGSEGAARVERQTDRQHQQTRDFSNTAAEGDQVPLTENRNLANQSLLEQRCRTIGAADPSKAPELCPDRALRTAT